MTLYMLFAGFGILIYTGAAYAVPVVAGFSSAHAAFGFQFAIIASLSMFLVAVVPFYVNRLPAHAFIVALVFGGAITIAIAATRVPSQPLGINASNGSPTVVITAESARPQAAGERLFQELGCIGCHRPDATGIGPALTGRFGRPVTEPGCGALTVDDEYLREAILNPSAIVAVGFPSVMPTFAGRLTEGELQALIVYVKSLSLLVD